MFDFALPAGATGDVALAALDDVVAPAVDRFAPDVGAGVGRIRRPPRRPARRPRVERRRLHARSRAASQDFAPAPGRLVLFLEGGYDLDALARSTTSTLTTLAGAAPPDLAGDERPTSGGPGHESVGATAAAHAQFT